MSDSKSETCNRADRQPVGTARNVVVSQFKTLSAIARRATSGRNFAGHTGLYVPSNRAPSDASVVRSAGPAKTAGEE